MEKLKSTYEESFRFMNEGLNLEERGKENEALLCYEKGLRSLNFGLKTISSVPWSSIQMDDVNKMKENMEGVKNNVECRIAALRASSVVDQMPAIREICDIGRSNASSRDVAKEDTWENAAILVAIPEGVCMFNVDSQKAVSTWPTPCQLKVFQLLEDHQDLGAPPAFLQCGEWIYPLHPGKSPALKTFHRTYMFPDLDPQSKVEGPASIGIVLADSISEDDVNRFERILSCYCDFRKFSAEDSLKMKPPRPPPPYRKQEIKEPSAPAVTDLSVVPYQPGEITDEDERHWSDKVSDGILIGAKWISWGVGKGAQVTSQMVEMGAVKLRRKIQPNEENTKVDPNITKNVQQIKEVTGAAVQVSGYIVTTLCALTVQLGKALSPIIRNQGSKLIPEKYKNGDESTQKTMDDIIKVTMAGIHGFGTVFNSLEEGGKALYKSLTKETVQTVNHKYGEEASEVTEHAMGAAGNTAQAYWNIKKLGAKAIAKRTAKDTGKAILHEESDRIANKR